MIERVANDVCVVSLDSGGVEQVPSVRVAAVAEQGRAVALERVNVLAKEIGYVMPVEIMPDEQDRELAAWFAKMAEPDTTPVLAEERSHYEPLPYRRSKPRDALWHGASTMTRRPMAG